MKLFRHVALIATVFVLTFSAVYAGKVEDNIRAYTSKATGRKYMTHYVHEWTVSNGKISSFKGVADMQVPVGK